jgi:hypothetical protein
MPTSKVSRGPACVLAANGQVAAAAPPRNVMNSRRRMCPPYRPPPVQWLKSSTLRPDGDQEMVHNRPETLIRPDVLWMAPALQEAIDAMARVGCSMESANKFPFCLSGYDALNIRWVVPVPGLTGLPSHRIALATS